VTPGLRQKKMKEDGVYRTGKYFAEYFVRYGRVSSGGGGTAVAQEVQQWRRRYNSGAGRIAVAGEVQQWRRRYSSGGGGIAVAEEV